MKRDLGLSPTQFQLPRFALDDVRPRDTLVTGTAVLEDAPWSIVVAIDDYS